MPSEPTTPAAGPAMQSAAPPQAGWYLYAEESRRGWGALVRVDRHTSGEWRVTEHYPGRMDRKLENAPGSFYGPLGDLTSLKEKTLAFTVAPKEAKQRG